MVLQETISLLVNPSKTNEAQVIWPHFVYIVIMELATDNESAKPRHKMWACSCLPHSILPMLAQPESTAA
uniref:Uncharacterized protein n=1 Tax=Rhizophora mucronata TaxID=61149 RepID=A0A2P2PMH8_RHIMU